MFLKRLLILILITLLPVLLAGRTLDEIRRSGKIYVAFTSTDLKSVNYDLALEFANYLNVDLIAVEIEWSDVFKLNGSIPPDMETNPDLIYTPDALKGTDIICSTLTILEWRKRLFGFARTLQSAEVLLINKNEELPRGLEDLSNRRIAYLASTTFEQSLNDINATLAEKMELVQTKSTEESQRLLEEGLVYGIALDADEALNFNVKSGNKYKIAFPISDISRTAWAVEKNNPLIQEVENFFETIISNGFLDELYFE